MSMVHTDAALTGSEREKDELNIAPFVRRLLRPILQWPADEGFVVGLYAPWGYGKTTILNFLEEELSTPQASGARGIVVRFNPWLYGTPEAMLASFFGTVASAVTKVTWLPGQGERLKALGTALSGVGELVPLAVASVAVPGSAILLPFAGTAIKGLAKLAKSGENDFRKHKDQARAHLLGLGRHRARLVVLIDDVDRAERPEVLALLKLVKLIGDLPNTTYVLAMDDARVRQLLDAQYSGETGAAYLEKIVQAPVYLPLIGKERLDRLVKASLTAVAQEAGFEGKLFPNGWEIIDSFARTIGRRVRTLRDRARLTNAFRFFLVSSEDLRDVNVEDALHVVFLQTFYPDAYDRVRTHKEFLTAEDEPLGRLRDGDDAERGRRRRDAAWYRVVTGETPAEDILAIHGGVEKVLREDPSHSPVHAALNALFPYALTGYQPGEGRMRAHRRNHEICVFEEFDRYFQLQPPPDEVPDIVVDTLLEEVVEQLANGGWPSARTNIAALFNSLARYPRTEQRSSIAAKLRDRLGSINYAQLPILVEALLEQQEKFPDNEFFAIVSLATSYIYAGEKRSRGRGEEDPVRAAEAATEVVVKIVEKVHGDLRAAAFAEDYLRGKDGWNLSEGSQQVIASAALARLAHFSARDESPFNSEILGFHRLMALWLLMERLVGGDGAGRKAYLVRYLERNRGDLVEYVAVFAAYHGNGEASFSPSEPKDVVFQYHERIVGIEALRVLLKRFLAEGLNDASGTVAQAAEYFASQ